MRRTEIEASANPKWKYLEGLLSAKGIKSDKAYILAGAKLVEEALQSSRSADVLQIVISARDPQSEAWLKTLLLQRQGLKPIEVWALTPALFRELDVLGTHRPMAVMRTPEILDYTAWDEPKGLVPLIPLGDPGNLGAVLRSAAAFGVRDVVLLQEAAHPFLPKVIRAAAGAHWQLRLWRGPSLANCSASELFVLDGGHVKATALPNVRWPQDCHLLVGEEGGGLHKLPDEIALRRIAIPMAAGIESLNAAVAMSVIFYDFQRATRSPPLMR